MADAELAGAAGGQVTEVRPAIAKRVAIHTSVMLPEEQRASEIAFENGVASIMFATGTLAQGLNLPATAVVIGGTAVGDRREANTPEGRARAKAQLLNAIGRAGRAQTAARSLAIVVPDQPLHIAATPAIAAARQRAAFLQDEDGSTPVRSRLDGLIAQSLDGTLQLQTMSVPEQTAFAFLSFTADSGDATEVLGRSLAAHAAGASARAEQMTDTLRLLGRQFLDQSEAPAWIATAAHRAGITLPAAVELNRRLRVILAEGPPRDIDGWTGVLLRTLSSMPEQLRPVLLADENLTSTAIEPISSSHGPMRAAAWSALAATLDAWLTGQPLTVIGAALHAQTDPIATSRVKGAAMPRTLKFIRNALEHDLTAAAGALVATIVTGAESDPDGPWALPEESAASLIRLPVAIRSGAADLGALTLLQIGVRPRVVAHLMANRSPVADDADDLGRRVWATDLIDAISDPDRIGELSGDPVEQQLMTAAAYVTQVL